MENFIFFGTSNNSVTVLKSLIDNGYHCTSVITTLDKPIGRKQILTPSPLKIFAQKNNIPVISVSNLNDISNPRNLGTLGLFAVVADFGLLIPANIIKLFPKGILNIHPSLLPAYQGATPVPFQILCGEKEGGVTIITINEKFDQGKIIAQEKFPIVEYETTDSLLTKGFSKGAELLINVLTDYLSGKIIPIPQDLSKKSYFPRFSRDDGFIDWKAIQNAIKGNTIEDRKKPAFMILAHIPENETIRSIKRATNALNPWPGIWTKINLKGSQKRLKIHKVHIENNQLVLDLVQLEGKNPVSFEQFKKAYKI
jgi:methionyl-tRNA formyltransferase